MNSISTRALCPPLDRKGLTHLSLACLSLLCSGFPLTAQTTTGNGRPAGAGASTATGENPDDQPIALSPFEVSSSSDTGYSASDTLAGNRLRTSVRDVGSAISIYTAKFLEDTGATNARDLLVYTTSGEVGGIRGNYSATLNKGSFFDETGSGQYVSPTGDTRLRGLAIADTTRGFFLTNIPFDSYNVDRVDIQRGANSILFGLASPGGVVNSNLNQAIYKNAGSVGVRVDQYGSLRGTLDYNVAILPKLLALRVDGLDDQTKYEQKEAWRHDKRAYAAVRFDPTIFSGIDAVTSFKASFEKGKVSGADPVVLPPRDQMTTWWTVANQARNVPAGTFDPALGRFVGYTNAALGYTDAGNYQTDKSGNVIAGGSPWLGDPGRWYENTTAIYLDPNSSVQGGGTTPAWMQRAAIPTLAGENRAFYNNFVGMRTGGSILGALHNQNGFWKDPVFTDPSIFDFYHHTLGGPNRFNGQDFKALNLSFSQTYLQNQVGFELAYDYQRIDARQENAYSWEDGGAINIDINTTLPDGRANPNFGRPFAASDFVDNFLDFRTRKAARATAFYDLDFVKKMGEGRLASILGRHTFTGMWSTQSDNHKDMRYSRSVLSGDVMQFINETGNPWNWENVAALHYLGPSLANASSPAGANISGIRAWQVPTNGSTGLIYDPNNHVWVTRPIGVINDPYYSTFGPSWGKQVVDSTAFVWQGHLLNDMIVPTIGWRHDRAKAYQATTPPNNLATGYAILDPSVWYLKNTPSNTVSGNNTSYSVVIHTLKYLKKQMPAGLEIDLTYNKSQNFSPSAGGEDIYGNPMPPQTGSTKDYGAVISLFDQRLQFRVIRFEAAAQNAQSGDVNTYFVIQEEVNFFNAAQNPFNIANFPTAVAAYNSHQVSDQLKKAWNWTETVNPVSGIRTATASRSAGYISDLADTTSKGYEFEIMARPVRGWDITFNASKTTAMEANNLKDLTTYMNDRIAVWTGTAGQMLPNAASLTTMADEARANIIIPYTTGLAKNGMAQQELHRWRWNLVTNYTFHSGPLTGFNIGGGVRWQDKIALGYGVTTNSLGSLIYDLNKPYFGPAQTNYDFWVGYERKLTSKLKWKIQLNARDLFQNDKLIPIAAQPDGTISTYRIAPETLYSLTNTISF